MSEWRPCLAPDLRVAALPGGCVAYNTARDSVHHLNTTAALILAFCDGSRQTGAIEEAVLAHSGDVEVQEISAWLTEARDLELLTSGPAAANSAFEMSALELADLAARLLDEDETTLAHACQQRATELAPDEADLWMTLGELSHIEKDREGARAAYRRYLELEPDDPEVEHILVALQDGEPPIRASDECIDHLYRRFSEFYDSNMIDDLEYRAPDLLIDSLTPVLPAQTASLDVLDLGCGTGLAGRRLRPWARTLLGVDLSAPMLERAKQRGGYDALEQAELTSWVDRNQRRFHLIVVCDVLIYFGPLEQVLRGLGRALLPGGVIALTLEKAQGDGWRLTDSGRYAHSETVVRAAAAGAGLEVRQIDEAVLRVEYGESVVGLVVLLQASR